ncbi:dihydrolipoyl dehydrogenase [Clostridium sp.]|uniref:dihydrolipoyl dehydrogenase n=1 Tax=Clostridium sp. TaxID=1506 RepID=UPI002FCC7657
MDKDIIVIGGGPGGYVSAIRAAQLGAKVALIERDKLGGTCLNRGCIPTKALNRNAEILNTLKNIDEFGINIDGYSINVEKIQQRKQQVIDSLVNGIDQLLKANKVEVIKGTASFKDKNTVIVIENGVLRELTGENIIIATGSKPALPPIEGINTKGIYTSEEILNFDSIPNSLAVIGGGVVGMELACIFNALGTKVTVMEYLPSILNGVDSDITKRVTVSLKKRGLEINTSTKVNKILKNDEIFTILGENKKGEFSIDVEKVLVSAGRLPDTEGLNLDGTGIIYDRKGIKTNANHETNIKGVYAIGDVNGGIMLAHVASHQGINVAETIMNYSQDSVHSEVPSCIFIFPEIASVGITEDQAKAKGMEYNVAKFMFGANGKALALGEGEGFIKVLSTKNADNVTDNTILGVHIMGPHASDLIHEGALAISKTLTVADIKNTMHAHPTLAEGFSEAVIGLAGEAIHLAPIKK